MQLTKEEKLAAFVSLLHLDNQQRVWLEQDNHFEEIWILLKHLYDKKNKDKLDKLKAEVEALLEIKEEKKPAFNATMIFLYHFE